MIRWHSIHTALRVADGETSSHNDTRHETDVWRTLRRALPEWRS
jgi:hypothetical protein